MKVSYTADRECASNMALSYVAKGISVLNRLGMDHVWHTSYQWSVRMFQLACSQPDFDITCILLAGRHSINNKSLVASSIQRYLATPSRQRYLPRTESLWSKFLLLLTSIDGLYPTQYLWLESRIPSSLHFQASSVFFIHRCSLQRWSSQLITPAIPYGANTQ